jgi:hypothetical protein
MSRHLKRDFWRSDFLLKYHQTPQVLKRWSIEKRKKKKKARRVSSNNRGSQYFERKKYFNFKDTFWCDSIFSPSTCTAATGPRHQAAQFTAALEVPPTASTASHAPTPPLSDVPRRAARSPSHPVAQSVSELLPLRRPHRDFWAQPLFIRLHCAGHLQAADHGPEPLPHCWAAHPGHLFVQWAPTSAKPCRLSCVRHDSQPYPLPDAPHGLNLIPFSTKVC